MISFFHGGFRRRWTSVCCLRRGLLWTRVNRPKESTRRRPLASEPWNSHSEDGGPVCLLPCLKSSVGLLTPSSCPLCMWNTVKKPPWHFSDFVAWMHSAAVSELPVAACHVTQHHSRFQGHRHRWCTLAALNPRREGFFLKNLPFRFQSSPSTWFHWNREKSQPRNYLGPLTHQGKQRRNPLSTMLVRLFTMAFFFFFSFLMSLKIVFRE